MPSQTVRHLIVVALCCAGVAALYLAPQPRRGAPVAVPAAQPTGAVTLTATPPARPTGPTPASQRRGSSGETAVYDPDQPVSTHTPVPRRSPAPSASSPSPTTRRTPPAERATVVPADPRPTPSASVPAPTAATARLSTESPGSAAPPTSASPTSASPTSASPSSTAPATTLTEPGNPARVTGVEVVSRTVDELGLRWDPATADAGIDYYEVYLNDQPMTQVTATAAEVPWLNDSTSDLTIAVEAVAADGARGERSAAITTTRPSPAPTSTPTTGGSSTEPSKRGTP